MKNNSDLPIKTNCTAKEFLDSINKALEEFSLNGKNKTRPWMEQPNTIPILKELQEWVENQKKLDTLQNNDLKK